MFDHLPGPRGLPLVGSLLTFQRDPIAFLVHLEQAYGPLTGFLLGSKPVVFTTSTSGIRTVLVDHARHFQQVYGPLKQIIGVSLITVDGAEHAYQRRLLKPLFVRRQVEQYTDLMCAATLDLLHSWHGKYYVEISSSMHQLALHIIGQVLFGDDVDLRYTTSSLRRELDGIFAYIENMIGVHTIKNLPLAMPGTPYTRFSRAIPRIQADIDQRIEQRRSSGHDGMEMMAELIRSRDAQDQPLTTSAIRDQLLGLLLAGHETIATVLTWTLHLLAQHPSIQQRLADAIHDVAGTSPPTLHTLDQIPLLEQVIKESLRLYPPVWHIAKRTSDPFAIDGHHISGGKKLMMLSPFVTHRSSEYWSDPTRFDPERFARNEPSDPLAFFPFGAGARMCLGMTFALLEARLLLAMLVQRFSFALKSRASLAVSYSPTLHPRQVILHIQARL